MGNNKDDTGTKVPRLRQYGEGHEGPFIVIAESITGNIPSAKLSSEICKEYGALYIRAVAISKRKIKLLMASGSAANRLVRKQSDNIKFNIPQRLVECMGVAYIETEVTDEELLEVKAFEKTKLFQFDSPKVLDIRRIIRNDSKIPTRTIVITFDGTQLPSHVELCKVLYSVKPYVYRVRQCKRCWRFGHHSDNCKSTMRCNLCLEKDIQDNHRCDVDHPKCVNCEGEHRADDTRCPVIQQKRIQESNRRTTFSQGSNDWFTQLSRNTHQPTQPEQLEISPSPSVSSLIIIKDDEHEPSAKRKCTDNEAQVKPNRDTLETIRNSINETITSEGIVINLAKALGGSLETEEDVAGLQNIVQNVLVPVIDDGFRGMICNPRL